MRDLKDYVTGVTHTPDLLNALFFEAKAGSPHCRIIGKGNNQYVTFIASKVPVVYDWLTSVGVARLTQEEVDWFVSLPTCMILGQAKDTSYINEDGLTVIVKGKFIGSIADVEWAEGGEAQYYATYDTSSKTYIDESGDEVEVIPPMLQGIMA